MDDAAKRVYFHVGAPKTGTTFLQQVLHKNREQLAADGVLFPYDELGQAFRSMLDFRRIGWAGHPRGMYAGEWEVVARRARGWDGRAVVVSQEILGGAKPRRIAKGVESVRPADVHVVFTARDLARQLVSDWQEHVKHQHTVTLEQFVDDLIEKGLDAPAPFGEMFWGLHDAAYVLGRWEQHVPAENIHVVTVPQPGHQGPGLWERFCQVLEIDPAAYSTEVKRSNPSMGVVETELVRRMNEGLRKMSAQAYDRTVRIVLAEQVLGGQSARLTLPPDRFAWVEQRSRQLVDQLRDRGYDVVGDLEELIPRAQDHLPHVSPTALTDADLAQPAIRAATALVRHAGKQQKQIKRLRARLGLGPQADLSTGARLRQGIAEQAGELVTKLRPRKD